MGKQLKPYLKWLLFAALVIYAVVMIIVQQLEIKAQTEQLGALATQEEELSDRIESLKSEIEYMQTDEYIERTARDRLGMVKEDEIIFKQTGEDTSEPTASAQPAEGEES